jgi:daunorubicin resistance ABC transporter ATP-binding subunit
VVDELVVEVEGVTRRFGDFEALAGVDLTLRRGNVLGLLGPNGAGKTTLVSILATLLPPTSGRARVLGHDVVTDAPAVRRRIGLTGQYAAVDGLLTGRENLRMFGRLFHLRPADAARRADELLARFDLIEAADRKASTYSGGMRRRLDLASSMLVRPELLFLDEPTTGLDPRSRAQIWDTIRDLVERGTTLLLTTQYLEEADQLADRIAVIDRGRIIAEGTGDQLKEQVGGSLVEVVLGTGTDPAGARELLGDLRRVDALARTPEGRARLSVVSRDGETGVGLLAAVSGRLADSDLDVRDVGLRRPTLDDVFLELTGSATQETP